MEELEELFRYAEEAMKDIVIPDNYFDKYNNPWLEIILFLVGFAAMCIFTFILPRIGSYIIRKVEKRNQQKQENKS